MGPRITRHTWNVDTHFVIGFCRPLGVACQYLSCLRPPDVCEDTGMRRITVSSRHFQVWSKWKSRFYSRLASFSDIGVILSRRIRLLALVAVLALYFATFLLQNFVLHSGNFLPQLWAPTKVTLDLRVEFPSKDMKREKAIVVLCYNRPEHLRVSLRTLKQLPQTRRYDVFVAQDGTNPSVHNIVSDNQDWLFHLQKAHLTVVKNQVAAAFLTQHYKWTLDKLFLDAEYSHVIILEDDLIVSPDFLQFMEHTSPLLDMDPTVWCISSWNDLGDRRLAQDLQRLFRTDFFPGLGWMLKRETWLELSPLFPSNVWDWWMRLDDVVKGRSCVCPEVPRNWNFGVDGSHSGNSNFDPEAEVNVDLSGFRNFAFNRDVVSVDLPDPKSLTQAVYDSSIRSMVNSSIYIPSHQLVDFLRQRKLGSPGSEVILSTYRQGKLQEFIDIIFRAPSIQARTRYKGTIVVNLHPGFLILCDESQSEFLPAHLRLEPAVGVSLVKSSVGGNCIDACHHAQLVCREDQFVFSNKCSVMKEHFPCRKGCLNHFVDEAQPAYQALPNIGEQLGFGGDDSFEYCLVGEVASACSSSRENAIRLCSCVPSLR